MENNEYENNVAPETEILQDQQPVENPQPAANKPDFAEMFNTVSEKAKDLAANSGVVVEKAKSLPKKIWALIGAGVVAVIALIVVLSILGNTYKTPIQTAEKLLNGKKVEKIINDVPELLNGFGEAEADKLLKIIKKCDQYEDTMEDAEDGFEELVENLKDEYGDNYKIKLKVEDKEKLEKEDLRDFRDQLRNIADFSEELEDMDSDDYEDMADELGLTKGQAKDMVKELESFCKKCKKAKVSAGYELDVVVTITGSEVDEPEENELTIRVFKVDGRWVPDVFSLTDMIPLGGLMAGMM